MVALLCVVVAAQKSCGSLPEFLRILPASPEMKSMVLESYRGVLEHYQPEP